MVDIDFVTKTWNYIDLYAGLINLPGDITYSAKLLAERAIKEDIALGFKPEEVAVATIYVACRSKSVPLLLKDLIIAAKVEASRVKGLYKRLLAHLSIKAPIPDPEIYLVKRLAPKLDVDEKTLQIALEIIKKAKENMLTQGKNPSGVAAAALYIALRRTNKPVSLSKLARTSSVTTVTIKNILKVLSTIQQ